jgi:catechol 2,3-dioxygenase-like lactoylglutathione lyase family enzyme
MRFVAHRRLASCKRRPSVAPGAGICPASRDGHYGTVAASPVKDVDMSADRNAPPKTGWANIVTELHVADLAVSLAFWTDIIGFDIAYRRDEEKFVYLEHPEGQQIMLCQRHGRFETGPMQHPLGQGAMFQIYFRNIGAILAKLAAQKWPIYLGPREVWRKTGDRESGQQEVFVQDPDGYLLMLAHSIGERALPQREAAVTKPV